MSEYGVKETIDQKLNHEKRKSIMIRMVPIDKTCIEYLYFSVRISATAADASNVLESFVFRFYLRYR